MMYNTSNALNLDSKDVAYLEGGIHENVKFVASRKDKSVNGNNFIEFSFDKNGSKLTHTEYEPKRFPDQSDDQFAEKANKQLWRMLHIMKAFVPEDRLTGFSPNSFDELTNWIVAIMSTVDKSIEVRLKVIYGKTGYTTLPMYSGYTFIEPMTVSKEDSKIKELSIDAFKKPELGDKENYSATGSSAFAAPQATAPF